MGVWFNGDEKLTLQKIEKDGKVFFEEKRLEIREILRKLCQWKGVEIIEGEVCPDHIHML